MAKFVSTLFCALLVASSASAEIFKCAGKNGLDLYQNFPCQFDSMGWIPDASSTKAAPPPAQTRATGTRNVATETRNLPSDVGDAQKADSPREIRPGMTFDDVRERWGEPEETMLEEPGHGSRYEIWTYANARTVRFDHKGRVSAVQP